MDKKIIEFFRKLLNHKEDLFAYINGLYEQKEYSEEDLNEIFGVLISEKLLSGFFSEGRIQECVVTYKGKHYFDDEERPYLLELIEQIDEIEKEFHSFDSITETISDSQIFQQWLQELQLELQLLVDKTGDTFINDTLVYVKRGIGGYNERTDFHILKAKLLAIYKKKDNYFSEKEINNVETNKKKPLIFISHSSKNQKQVELFTELLLKIGLKPQEHVFCSSVPGYDIPLGEKIYEFLRRQFTDHSLHVIFILSKEYYNSPSSLNEMGATWITQANHTPILLPGFSFSEMKGVVEGDVVAIKLDHDKYEVKDKLNQLKNSLIKEFKIERIPDSVWEKARDNFIDKVNSLPIYPEKEKPDKTTTTISKETFDFLTKISESPNETVFICPNLSHGHSIEIGNETIATEYPDRREYAKWEEVIDNCVKFGYLKKSSETMYVLTNTGYQIIGK